MATPGPPHFIHSGIVINESGRSAQMSGSGVKLFSQIRDNDVLIHPSKSWPWLGVARRFSVCANCSKPTKVALKDSGGGKIDFCGCATPSTLFNDCDVYLSELDNEDDFDEFLQSFQASTSSMTAASLNYILSQMQQIATDVTGATTETGGEAERVGRVPTAAKCEGGTVPAVVWQPSAGPMRLCDGSEITVSYPLPPQPFDYGLSVVHKADVNNAKARLGIVKGTEHLLDAFVLPSLTGSESGISCQWVLCGLADVDSMRPIELLDDAYYISETGWLGQPTGQRCTLTCSLLDRKHCQIVLGTEALGESWERSFLEDATPTYLHTSRDELSKTVPCAGATLRRFDAFSLFKGQSVFLPLKYLVRSSVVKWQSNPIVYCDCVPIKCDQNEISSAFRKMRKNSNESDSNKTVNRKRKSSRRKSALANLSDFKSSKPNDCESGCEKGKITDDTDSCAEDDPLDVSDSEKSAITHINLEALQRLNIALYDNQANLLDCNALSDNSDKMVEISELDIDWLCCVTNDGDSAATERLPRTLDKQQISTLRRMEAATPEQVAMSGLRYEYTIKGNERLLTRENWRKSIVSWTSVETFAQNLDVANLKKGDKVVLYVIRDNPTSEILWEDNEWQNGVRWHCLRYAPIVHGQQTGTDEHGVQQMSLQNGLRDYYPGTWVCSSDRSTSNATSEKASQVPNAVDKSGDHETDGQRVGESALEQKNRDAASGAAKKVGLVVTSKFADRVCLIRWYELSPPNFTDARVLCEENMASYEIRPYKPFNYMFGCLVTRVVFDGDIGQKYNVGYIRKKVSDGRVLVRFYGSQEDTLHWPWHLKKSRTNWRYTCYDDSDNCSNADAHNSDCACSHGTCDDVLNDDIVDIEWSDDEQHPGAQGDAEKFEDKSYLANDGALKALDFDQGLKLNPVAKHTLAELVAWNVQQLVHALAICAAVVHVYLPRVDRSQLMIVYEHLTRPLEFHQQYMRAIKNTPAASDSRVWDCPSKRSTGVQVADVGKANISFSRVENGFLAAVAEAVGQVTSSFNQSSEESACKKAGCARHDSLFESSQMELAIALSEYVNCRSAANHEYKHWCSVYDKRSKAESSDAKSPQSPRSDTLPGQNQLRAEECQPVRELLDWVKNVHEAISTVAHIIQNLLEKLCSVDGVADGNTAVTCLNDANLNLVHTLARKQSESAPAPFSAVDAFLSEEKNFPMERMLTASRRLFFDLESRKDFLPYWDQTYYGKKGDPYARYAAPYKVHSWQDASQPLNKPSGTPNVHEKLLSHILTIRKHVVEFHDRRDSEARRDADCLRQLAPGSVDIADAMLFAAVSILHADVAALRESLRKRRESCGGVDSTKTHWSDLDKTLVDLTNLQCGSETGQFTDGIGSVLSTIFDSLSENTSAGNCGDDEKMDVKSEEKHDVHDVKASSSSAITSEIAAGPDVHADEQTTCALSSQDYGTALSPDCFAIIEKAPSCHLLIAKRFDSQTLRASFHKSVRREHKLLHASLPHGIMVKTFENRMDLFSALLHGPPGTPYECGLFMFDIKLPDDYSSSPPIVHYRSMNMRLNPNLYENGTVCLSLIGTWDGEHPIEKWSAQSNLVQVLLSIQGLVLVSEPYFCEPGFETSRDSRSGQNASRDYNEMTIVLVLKSLERLVLDPPGPFCDEIKASFLRDIDRLCKLLSVYADQPEEAGFRLSPVTEGFRITVLRFKDRLKKLAEKLSPTSIAD